MIKRLINRSRGDDALGPKMALRTGVSNDASLNCFLSRRKVSLPQDAGRMFCRRLVPPKFPGRIPASRALASDRREITGKRESINAAY